MNYFISFVLLQFILGFVCNANVLAQEDKLIPPPSYSVAIRAIVDNSKGAVLRVEDPKSPVYGATVTIPPGSLIRSSEEVLLSYSKKLPMPMEKTSASKQVSYAFMVQVDGCLKESNIKLKIPVYHQSSYIKSHIWNESSKGFVTDSLSSIYPNEVYIMLDVGKDVYEFMQRLFSKVKINKRICVA